MARPVEPEHAVLRPGDRLRAVPPQHVRGGLVRAELEERVALREARVPVADELDGDDALGLVERRDIGLVGEGREVALPEGARARGRGEEGEKRNQKKPKTKPKSGLEQRLQTIFFLSL